MKRRKFLQQGALASLSALTLGGLSTNASATPNEKKAAGQPFNMLYAPHDGMFKNSGGDNFLDQIKYMHDQGFRAIEDNGMLGRDTAMQDKIGSLLAQKNMTMGVFVVDTGNNWKTSLASGKQEFKDAFIKTCKQSVETAKRVNAKWATVVPGFYDRSLPMGIQTAHVVDALRRGAEIFEPHGLVMVLEPLSDTPDLFLRTAEQSFEVCKAVNSPSCKILYDIYHMQRNTGHLIPTIDMCWDEIAYIQIGDNPGRKEPGTGEINYKNIFKHLHQKGYKGVLGMEHGNSIKGAEGEAALIKAYRDADNFL
ncbi:hydroxypyruvate isomerase [Chitinophaga dinghuensis]|uniref:Hydroxypyruvate isomerase n=1 Tax=Chitinophaga dinghuensis TaxID=1539050 RepID=A0A327WDS2_9BACT|nr:TIM barrel protein [Chitinophaga dinghuensis]RAJ85536.1 hydroxypyruvate isomerase [Chitinophaga dinghuensis]